MIRDDDPRWKSREASMARDSGGEGNGEIDPIIRGLLVRLPKSGEVWPEGERKVWLALLAGSFKLIVSQSRERIQ